MRGPHAAAATVVEYGDYECRDCDLTEPVVRHLVGMDVGRGGRCRRTERTSSRSLSRVGQA